MPTAVTLDDPVLKSDRQQPRSLSGRWRMDLLVTTAYTLAGIVLTFRLWRNPEGRYLGQTFASADQQAFEFFIGSVTHRILSWENPLFNPLVNAPDGINMMAQTSILGLSIPLIPVTVLFGPAVTFLVILTLSFPLTAASWYWVFSRTVTESKMVAAVAAAFCGFAPPMISHGFGGHLNYVANFVLPFIVYHALKLGAPGSTVRRGLYLGLLITWQIFIGEEPLLLAALGIGVFVVAYAALDWATARDQWRRFLGGLAVAVAVTSVLTAYPLWYQFNGPQSYASVAHAASVGNDVFSLTTYASQSIGGTRDVEGYAFNPSEENGFFGWALLALCAAAAIWMWNRSTTVRATAITAMTFLLLSLGTTLVVRGHRTDIPMPWKVFTKLPLVSSILPARLAFVAIPAIALLLALATQRIRNSAREYDSAPARWIWPAAVFAVLLPLVPFPSTAKPRLPVPTFFTAGTWRSHIAADEVVIPVPLPKGAVPGGGHLRPMSWMIEADYEFRYAGGYFIGPHGPNRAGGYDAEPRKTSTLLLDVWKTGTVPNIGEKERADAHADMNYWDSGVLVLERGMTNHEQLETTVTALFGPGKRISDVTVWRLSKT